MAKAWKICAALLIIALTFLATYSSMLNSQLSNALTNVEGERDALKSENEKLLNKYNVLELNYSSLMTAHQQLNSSYNILLEKYLGLNSTYNALLIRYQSLNETYSVLVVRYNSLNASYDELLTRYQSLNASYYVLLTNYNSLNASYGELFGQYQSLNASYNVLLSVNSSYTKLYEAFYEPLTDITMPTLNELKAWLAEDPTDSIEYSMPNFICGDFATMLSMHAKLKNWRMGVIALFATKADGSSFNHAFNAIICNEGLAYVEPQTDSVWWYDEHSEMQPGEWYNYPGVGQIHVEDYIIVVLY